MRSGQRHHLLFVERHEEAGSRPEGSGQAVVPLFQLVQDFLRGDDVAYRDGGVEALPDGPEDVWWMVPADVDPDARVDHVRRGHSLRECASVIDRPCDPLEVLDPHAETVADVRERTILPDQA